MKLLSGRLAINLLAAASVSQTLASRIAKLSGTASGLVPSMLTSFDLPHQWKNDEVMTVASADDKATIVNLLRGARSDAFAISDALSQRYFSHAEAAVSVVGA